MESVRLSELAIVFQQTANGDDSGDHREYGSVHSGKVIMASHRNEVVRHVLDGDAVWECVRYRLGEEWFEGRLDDRKNEVCDLGDAGPDEDEPGDESGEAHAIEQAEGGKRIDSRSDEGEDEEKSAFGPSDIE